jgi:hypothetical protein
LFDVDNVVAMFESDSTQGDKKDNSKKSKRLATFFYISFTFQNRMDGVNFRTITRPKSGIKERP